MKFSISTAGALAAILFTTDVSAATEAQRCMSKHPAMINAIQKFCQKTDMVIPSSYAYNGAYSDARFPRKAHVTIQGSCSPKQWVPQHYCFSQFQHICAIGDSTGQGVGYFGRNACQRWIAVDIYD